MKRKFAIGILLLAAMGLWATESVDSTTVEKKASRPMAYRISGMAGMIMPDGKADQWIERPVLGGSFGVEFLPTGKWHCLSNGTTPRWVWD